MNHVKRKTIFWAFMASCLFMWGCQAAPPHESPEPRSPLQPSLSMPADLANLIVSEETVHKAKLRASSMGVLQKVSVYHSQPSASPKWLVQELNQRYAGKVATAYETEWYQQHGKVHEVEFVADDGNKCELAFTDDHAYLYTECILPAEELPQPVSQAVEKLLPGATIHEAATERQADSSGYHVTLKVGERSHHLFLDPTGRLVRHSVGVPAEIEVVLK